MFAMRGISWILLWGLVGCTSPGDDVVDSETDTDTDVDTDTDTDTETDTDTDPVEEVTGQVQYPHDWIHSPITAEMAEVWRERIGLGSPLQENVFMKVGASSTVSSRTLYCFAGDGVNLSAYESLQPTLSFYLQGDAAGTTPFDRVTLAAKSGRTARWVMSGEPSPIASEYEAILPTSALIHYGTNDMGMGSTYASAMPDFYDAMMDLMEWLIDRGVLPILTAISHRGDRETANRWVPTYNTLIRGMAQGQRVPYLNLYEAMDPLENHGLSSDGIHLNKGPYGTCDFSSEALAYGYNMRNLIALQAFDRVKQVLVDGVSGLDKDPLRLQGAGLNEDPFVIEQLPFADFRDTNDATQSEFDVYDCDDADESGPEFVYELELTESLPLRIMVMDRDEVDVDIHLLDENFDCLERGHRQIDTRVGPGTFYITADTWVDNGGVQRKGAYQLIVVECASGDTSCQ